MRYRFLIEQIYQRPWFITLDAHRAIQKAFQVAVARRGMVKADDEETDEDVLKRWDDEGIKLSDMINARRPMELGADGIARIHILGPMARNLSKLERACGATGLEQIASELNQAVEARSRGILVSMNTPGGTVNGTPEVAELLADIATKIPLVVHTADMIASGGMYIAAGATRIIAAPSAYVGSIGVVFPWVDFSGQMEQEGLVGEPITNKEGDLKGAGWVTGSLTDAQRAQYQAEADQMFAEFKGHVVNHRAVPDWAMRGQVLTGTEMTRANLVDDFGDEAHALTVLASLMK